MVKRYYNDFSNHLGVHRIYDLKTLFGDHFLWHVEKERPKILAQFGIKALPYSVCKETFDDRMLAYLSSRLTQLGLDAGIGTAENISVSLGDLRVSRLTIF